MNTTFMNTASSTQPQPDSPSRGHSIFQIIGAVVAALATWILVATVLNLPLRISRSRNGLQFYLRNEARAARLGSRVFTRGRICRGMDWKGPNPCSLDYGSNITWSFHS